MKHRVPFLALALTALLAGHPVQASDWTITDLGRYDGRGMALNDGGWVVQGARMLAPGPGGYAVVATLLNAQGTSENLWFTDINNANVALGLDRTLTFQHAFTWQAGIRAYLPELPDFQGWVASSAKGINDGGQIVGNTGDLAYLWTPNGSGGYHLTSLGVDLGWTIGSGEAAAINGLGSGLMSQVYNSYRTGYSSGVGSTTIIPDMPGYTPVGRGINDQHAVVGYSVTGCGPYACSRPFFWRGPEVTLLPLATVDPSWGASGEASALNEANQVVGGAYFAAYDRRAYLWTNEGTGWVQTDLNTLLPAGSAFYQLADALDINESGQILGVGSVVGDGQQHVFLLTPGAVPEPACWLMLAAGLGALQLARRRRLST